MRKVVFLILIGLTLNIEANTQAQTTEKLSTILVEGTRENKEDKPFYTPSATSKLTENTLGRDINEYLRTSPSLFTQHDIGQGGIAVNMRGLEGLGRINTTIDGVSQTFYQMNPAHGWNGNTVYINEDFITEVQVNRGLSSGNIGANALGGSVNFRTISAEDLVEKNRRFGSRLILRTGSNGYGQNGMFATAYHDKLSDDGYVSALVAYGGKIKKGYKNGAGEVIAGDDLDDKAAMESGGRGQNMLAKIAYAPNKYHQFKFTYLRNYSHTYNNHTPMKIQSYSGLAEYYYTPLSDYINLHTSLAYSKSTQRFTQDNYDNGYQGRKTRNPTLQFDIHNRSHFELGEADLEFKVGAKLLDIRYNADKHGNTEPSFILVEGKQRLSSLFTEAEVRWENLMFLSGIRYEQYTMQGYLPPTEDDGAIVFPKGGNIHFKRKENHLNPYISLAYLPVDWLQLYVNYAHTSRAPNVQEFMYANNAQNNPYSINPYLKGEQSINRNIGFNILKQSTFQLDDEIRLKVNYFNNRVKNYITQQQFYICSGADHAYHRCSLDGYTDELNHSTIPPVGIFLNQPERVKMHGWEVEGGYDFGRGYVNISWTKTTTNTPTDWLADITSTTRTQPSSKFILDLGTRWLDKRLIIGARMTRMGNDTIPAGIDFDSNQPTVEQIKGGQKIYDLYAIYHVNKQMKLFLNVENLTNTIYNYPLSSGGTLGVGNTGNPSTWANQGTGRGRTIYGGLQVTF